MITTAITDAIATGTATATIGVIAAITIRLHAPINRAPGSNLRRPFVMPNETLT